MAIKEIKEIAFTKTKKNISSLFLTDLIIVILLSLSTKIPVAGTFLVFGPLTLGRTIIFYKNSNNQEYSQWEIFTGFNDNFAKSMFIELIKALYLALWLILLVIPGIIKTYSYSMTSFLLMKEPDIDISDAFKKSKKLMKGNKMNMFLLDLSFLGWYIMNFITYLIKGVLPLEWHMASRMELMSLIYETSKNQKENKNSFKYCRFCGSKMNADLCICPNCEKNVLED